MPSKGQFQARGRVRHFVAGAPIRLQTALTEHLKLEKAASQDLLGLGAVYCNKRRVREDRMLRKGDYLRVHIQPKRYPLPTLDWKGRIVAETAEYLVVNKPPGVPMHAMLDNEIENLLYQLRTAGYPELWVTQRLDNDTEGLCVLARTKNFQRSFNQILRERQLTKKYRMWVRGEPALGTYVHYMRPTPWAPKEVVKEAKAGWARCELVITQCRQVASEDNEVVSEVEVRLVTGRTHQIRTQLAFMGFPLLGDTLYGGTPAPFLALQSFALEFIWKGKVSHEVPSPAHWNLSKSKS